MCPAPSPQPWHPCPDPDNAQEFQSWAGQEFPCSVRGLGPSQWPPQPCPRVPRPRVSVCGGCVPRRTLGQQDKRYFLSPSLSFPCQAPPGASGAEARPPSDSISYQVNPCRAGLEGQENRDMPAGKVTRCDRPTAPVATPVPGLAHLLLTLRHKKPALKPVATSLLFLVLSFTVSRNFRPHEMSSCSSITNSGGFNVQTNPRRKPKPFFKVISC